MCVCVSLCIIDDFRNPAVLDSFESFAAWPLEGGLLYASIAFYHVTWGVPRMTSAGKLLVWGSNEKGQVGLPGESVVQPVVLKAGNQTSETQVFPRLCPVVSQSAFVKV